MLSSINSDHSFKLFQQVKKTPAGLTVGHETLLRTGRGSQWTLPADFIQSAECSGSIVAIGAWAIREAARLSDAHPEMGAMAVNISPAQIASTGWAGLIDLFAQAINDNGGARLDIEITETALALEMDLASKRRLDDLGVRVHIDDYGTGFSNLSAVWKSGAHAVKIDKSLIHGLNDPRCLALVAGTIRTMTGAGIDTIAEGVETEEQANVLAEMGCGALQGFWIGRPFDVTAGKATIIG